jgi:hypothetical protein
MADYEEIISKLKTDRENAARDAALIVDDAAAAKFKTTYLSPASVLAESTQAIKSLEGQVKPLVGQASNEHKQYLTGLYDEAVTLLKEKQLQASLASEKLDITLPGRPIHRGRLHPDTQILRELLAIFSDMGFQVFQSREVETDEYNFQLLNFPVGHPARDMQDTYFMDVPDRGDNPLVLRTHTSPGQIRATSLRIFDRSFAVTYWLQAVAIAIGLFGVAASFSAQVLARRKEFGLLAHLGLTKRQILTVVAFEGAAWTLLGALAGLALGLVVSSVLVHMVNPQSFHWTMDLMLPWLKLLGLCLAVVAAGTLTAWLAAQAAAGQDAVLAVKEDW